MTISGIIGLDPTRFQNNSNSGFQEKEIFTFSSQISDKERFRDTDPLTLRCRACKSVFVFNPIVEDMESVSGISVDRLVPILMPYPGIQTGNIQNEGISCACGQIQSTGSVSVQVELQLRAHISKYYEAVLGCSDCGEKTRSMSVYGKRCVARPNCRGEMRVQVRAVLLTGLSAANASCYPVYRLATLQSVALLRISLRCGEGDHRNQGHFEVR